MGPLTSIRHKILSVIFVSLLFSCILYILFFKQGILYSELELRKLHNFSQFSLRNFKHQHFQKAFEMTLSDRFPLRKKALQSSILIDYQLHKLTTLNKRDYSLIKIKGDTFTFNRPTSHLVMYPYFLNNNALDTINKSALTINKLYEKHQDKNFIFFKPFMIKEANFFDRDNQFKSSGQKYVTSLKQALNPNIIFLNHQYDHFQDYQKDYYKSDYHWNHLGLDRGYRMLEKTLNKLNGTNINLEKGSEFCLNHHLFYGSLGREAGYLFGGDYFCGYNYHLKEYKVTTDTQNYLNQSKYQNNSASLIEWNNVFMDFYGDNVKEVKFEVINNQTKRNLLVINDSFVSGLKRLLAQHYDHSYFLDPRFNKNLFNELDTFIKEKEITDIIFVISIYSMLNNRQLVSG